MRLIVTTLICCLALPIAAVEARIDGVELHRSGATITRIVEVEVDPSAPRVVIDDLPASVVDQLQISADGDTLIHDVEVDIVRNTEAFNLAVRAKQDEIGAVEQQIASREDDSRIARLKLSFLKDVAAPPNATDVRAVETWSATLDALDGQAETAYARIRANDADIDNLDVTLDKLRAELDALSGATPASATVRLSAITESRKTVRIEISHFDYRALWASTYDASLDSVARTLTLDQKAAVRQWTGEDWNDVRLILGRNNPTGQSAPPAVSTQFVGLVRPRAMTRRAPGIEEVVVTGQYLKAQDAGADEATDLGALDTDFVARYVLPGRFSVPANRDKPREVEIESFRTPIDLHVRAVPRQTDNAFLMARMTPPKDLPSGRLALFVDGRYTGQTQATRLRANESTDLPMGADENVSVKVTELGFEEDEVGFIGRRVVEGHAWRFEITNHHEANIPVEIYGRIPTSEHDDIEVSQPRDATRPDRRDIDDQPGVIAWDRNLAPGTSTTIRHIFKVEYPADRRVQYRDG